MAYKRYTCGICGFSMRLHAHQSQGWLRDHIESAHPEQYDAIQSRAQKIFDLIGEIKEMAGEFADWRFYPHSRS